VDRDPDPAGASFTSLGHAHRRQVLVGRWLRAVALAVLLAMALVSARASPAPSLHGGGLAVSLVLLVLAASIAGLLSGARQAASLLCLILASSLIAWLQPDGTGAPGLFLALAVLAMRWQLRVSLPSAALAMSAFAVAETHSHHAAAVTVGVELGALAFFVLSLFARSAEQARQEAERLMVALDATREDQAEAAAMRERSRLARDMHDILAHSLSGLMLQLEGARLLARRSAGGDRSLSTVLDRAHHLASSGLAEARHAVGMLRDDELPGPDRLDELASDFERDSRIATTVRVAGMPRELPSEARLTVYRVAQEALTNTRRHACAQRVELNLSYEPTGTRLIVEDHAEQQPDRSNGAVAAGVERAHANGDGGYGLAGMRERAELLGGRLRAGPTGHGFRVELWVPV